MVELHKSGFTGTCLEGFVVRPSSNIAEKLEISRIFGDSGANIDFSAPDFDTFLNTLVGRYGAPPDSVLVVIMRTRGKRA